MILEKIPRDEEKESSSTSRNLVFFVVIFLAAGGLSFLLLAREEDGVREERDRDAICKLVEERSDRQAHHLDTNRLSGLLSGALPFFSFFS